MKEVLLAKSNFKKKKNITIAIGLIMLLTAFLISLSLLLMLDAYPNSNKYAKKLNAGDGVSIIYNDFTDIDDNAIEIALAGAKEYQKTDYLFFPIQSIKTKTGERRLILPRRAARIISAVTTPTLICVLLLSVAVKQ